MRYTREQYDKYHQLIAEKYKTSEFVVEYIRSLAGEGKSRDDIIKQLTERLDRDTRKLAKKRISWEATLLFLQNMDEKEFASFTRPMEKMGIALE